MGLFPQRTCLLTFFFSFQVGSCYKAKAGLELALKPRLALNLISATLVLGLHRCVWL
jgi:hypothetical protein